jgi:hypothetical protein
VAIQSLQGKHRLTERQKRANDFQWFKDQADMLDKISLRGSTVNGFGAVSEYKRKKVNYDLFNNIVDIKEFTHVCQPFGAEVGDLPANFTNRDIVSPKIKVLLGMEMNRPFSWKVAAINEEATTRKEEEEFNRIRDFVVDEVMKPIRLEKEKALKEAAKGGKLNPEELQELQSQLDAEIEAKTPDKVRKYMSREHQDPAEALSRQLLEYLLIDKKINHKFNKGMKHLCLSGEDVYWVGILNGEPDIEVVNSQFFDYGTSSEEDFIHKGEWAVYERRLTPSQVIAKFGDQLTEDEIDRIYNYHSDPSRVADANFTFNEDINDDASTVRVLHCNWKALKMIKFLTYLDDKNKVQMMIVDENYKLNVAQGDIKLEVEWIPFSYETYKILDDIYVHCRAVPGQNKDWDNLWDTNLSYFGAAIDNLNSPVTAPMDRLKGYQYFYNVIIYRIELLMASDKGKILASNINAIPKSSGIDVNKWHYFMEANKIAWYNPNEEGNKGFNGDVGSLAKVIDMSLVSDIEKYMRWADYIDRKAGLSIGVTPQMEAQIAAGDAVTNTQQNLIQASYIIQPIFELHNTVKAEALQGLLDVAKTAYSQRQPRKLSYVLDDMTHKMLTTDPELLENSRYGLYVANSAKADQAKKAVESLSQAALQNQQADLADIIKVIKSDSITEAEELLDEAADRKNSQLQAIEMSKIKAQKEAAKAAAEEKEAERAHERDMIILKERERRETEVQKQAILSMGFNENKDVDKDGRPDVLEVAQHGLNAQIAGNQAALDQRKQDLEEQKFEHQKEVDKESLKIENKKANKTTTK